MDALDDAAHTAIATARRAWAAGWDPGFYVLDLDGTLLTAHSEKEGEAPTYKRSFGFYPLVAFLDGTGLAGLLRPATPGRSPQRTTAPSGFAWGIR